MKTQPRVALLFMVLALLLSACTSTATTIAETASTNPDPTPTTAGATPTEPVPAPTLPAAAPTPDVATDKATETETTEPETESAPVEDDEPANDDPGDDVPVSGSVEVILIDAGAEPRTELRLEIAASCGEIMTMTQTQELIQTVDGRAGPDVGAVGNIVQISTTATRQDDNYIVRAEVISAVASPGTPPELAATLNNELANLVGLTSFATVSNRGVQVPGTSRVEGAEALGPFGEMLETLNQTQAPMPIEAVGVGARWETIATIDLQGVALVTTTETELVSIDGTVIELLISARQDVELGSIMVMQGVEATVTEWASSTTGETTIDLATISPIMSQASTRATQGFEFGTGATTLIEQEILSDVVMSGAPNDGCIGRTIRP